MSGPARDAWNKVIPQGDTGNNQNTNTNDQNTNRNSDVNASNDGTIDDKMVDDIWKEVKRENSTETNNQQNNQNNQNNQNTQVDPTKQLETYLDSVGLKAVSLSDQDKEDLKNGEFGNVLNRINSSIQTAHIQALKSANTIIEARVQKAVEDAVNKSKSIMSGDKMLSELHAKLPFTKDGAIGPVAQTIMQRFLDRGMTSDEAIKGVRKWFDKASNVSTPPNNNPNLSGSYRGGRSENSSDTDWIDILSPKG